MNLNGVFTVTREVKDQASGALIVPADYSELGVLLVTVTAIGFAAPMAAILASRLLGLRSGAARRICLCCARPYPASGSANSNAVP